MINFGVLITMFNEFSVVQRTVDSIKSIYRGNVFISVVQSDDGSGRVIEGVEDFDRLENLGITIKHHRLAAHAITRNYSFLFSKIYNKNMEYDFLVALTGDTLVTDPSNFIRLYNDMFNHKKLLCCSQAISQNFHAPNADPENGLCGGRYQYDGISDFMPQFFLLDGNFARKTKIFSKIEITNEFTSEQCLGNEFMKYVQNDFSDNAIILAKNAYDYNDGIRYQIRS
jgi:hypothetical protein